MRINHLQIKLVFITILCSIRFYSRVYYQINLTVTLVLHLQILKRQRLSAQLPTKKSESIMKSTCILLLIFATAFAVGTLDQEWQEFKDKFNKKYSSREDVQRRKIFIENKLRIVEHNKRFDDGKESFKMGINQFSDMLPDEMKQCKGFSKKAKKLGQSVSNFRSDDAYPESVDWRDSGCVSPVMDQGQCGSSWAFPVSGSIESICCIKYGDPVVLSTQNLIDCDSYGCMGGFFSDGFDYCAANEGLDTEESYPYTGVQGTCQFDSANAECPCHGYVTIPSGDEDELLAAVATVGPVATAIDASHSSFQMYISGVYYEESCTVDSIDHGVLVVGYGTDAGEDYWIVKNSWGTNWGESGYIRMARNRDNNCGIASEASYPLL